MPEIRVENENRVFPDDPGRHYWRQTRAGCLPYTTKVPYREGGRGGSLTRLTDTDSRPADGGTRVPGVEGSEHENPRS